MFVRVRLPYSQDSGLEVRDSSFAAAHPAFLPTYFLAKERLEAIESTVFSAVDLLRKRFLRDRDATSLPGMNRIRMYSWHYEENPRRLGARNCLFSPGEVPRVLLRMRSVIVYLLTQFSGLTGVSRYW